VQNSRAWGASETELAGRCRRNCPHRRYNPVIAIHANLDHDMFQGLVAVDNRLSRTQRHLWVTGQPRILPVVGGLSALALWC
jgi:hypothetical protein